MNEQSKITKNQPTDTIAKINKKNEDQTKQNKEDEIDDKWDERSEDENEENPDAGVKEVVGVNQGPKDLKDIFNKKGKVQVKKQHTTNQNREKRRQKMNLGKKNISQAGKYKIN